MKTPKKINFLDKFNLKCEVIEYRKVYLYSN
ncbi:MAG: hypothetical protein BWY34_00257 [Parcubacteria group bacterium ADurb.Bin247]|nr:MAG: hypothetical protein BWY34_00257 [Parcubacteria group bacterium ADurb.Bin247]